jgi:hypothetical protein
MVYGTYSELVTGANLNQLITGGASNNWGMVMSQEMVISMEISGELYDFNGNCIMIITEI